MVEQKQISIHKEKMKASQADKQGKDISQLITLVFHSVKFPDPSLPNKPEFFDIKDPGKNIMSFGRIKLFNDEILHTMFTNKQNSPIYKMKLIRSRLQAFIDTYTFPYMNGLGNALPDPALQNFTEIVKDLNKQYKDARELYTNSWSELRERCISYYGARPELYPGITEAQMKEAITRKLLTYTNSLDSKFRFQVTHFNVKPIDMSMEESDVAEKQVQIDARNEVAHKAGQDFNKMINDFQNEVKHDLRTQTVGVFNDLLEAIEKDQWNQKSINAVLKYIDKFKKLNFLNDQDLENFLDSSKKKMTILSAQEVKKSNGSIDNLHDMVEGAVGELKKFAANEKSKIADGFGAMGNRTIDPF